MFDIAVRGADDLARVGRLVKESGDKGLRRELYRSLNSAVKPLGAEVKRRLPEYVPDAYAAQLAPRLRVSGRRRMGQRNPALYLVGTAKGRRSPRFVGPLDKGILRHPLFENRDHWFSNRVRPGFWVEPLTEGADKVRRELVEALDRIARKVTS